jgi:GNAT superfamily N-acetyltransferase
VTLPIGGSAAVPHGGEFTLRFAQQHDVPLVRELIGALAEYERLTQLCVATEHDLETALFGPKPAAEVLLAEKAGESAGFALFFHTFSTFLGRRGLWLEDLFVRPAFRRQGCGKALLHGLARIARERGCGRFEWTVLDWNAQAIGFYESIGATVLPDWRIVRVVGPALHALATTGSPQDDQGTIVADDRG